MSTPERERSRERFLAQWDRCRQFQNENLPLPAPPSACDTVWTAEFIPEEPLGNGAPEVECEYSSIYALMQGMRGDQYGGYG